MTECEEMCDGDRVGERSEVRVLGDRERGVETGALVGEGEREGDRWDVSSPILGQLEKNWEVFWIEHEVNQQAVEEGGEHGRLQLLVPLPRLHGVEALNSVGQQSAKLSLVVCAAL